MENVRFCVTVKKAISQIIIDDYQINANITEDSDGEDFFRFSGQRLMKCFSAECKHFLIL